jgi:penicillin-binding protein 1C
VIIGYRVCGLLVVVTMLMASCGRSALPSVSTALIGPRAATNPLAAAEGYLQQYQSGPHPRLFQSTRIYDRYGTLIAELADEGHRTWIPLARISPNLINATIATEDASFYRNSGIDPLRIARAFVTNFQAGQIVSGASTITMQLARNLFLGPEQRYDQSVDRKLLEAGLAQELTALYSKDELLEMYLNLLNYGNLAYGPEAAAQRYFGKPAADLTLAEATMLAGIPQQPAVLDPYKNFEGVRQRQRIVLDLLVRHGYLSAREADFVYQQPLTLQAPPAAPPNLAPHFVQYVIDTLEGQLGAGTVRRGGFTITTTLDQPLQTQAQQIVAGQVAALREGADLSNAALVAMKPQTGEILVMVGSADFADASIAGQVNVATSLRQPGSAIKPILYAAVLEENVVSPASVLWDVPVTYTLGSGQNYTPRNYAPRNYDNRFHGPVTVRSALANSYNVPTVKLLAALGVERMLAMARSMGIQSLTQPADYYGLSLTLGGGELSLLELTTAYHTLASEGRYSPPLAILAINDGLGTAGQLRDTAPAAAVLTPETAYLITSILMDNEARTPMFGAQSLLALNRPAAAKTGTTTDFRDNWTIGYTRYLVAGVWAGNSDGRPMRNTSGVTGAAPIWQAFMQTVINDPSLQTALDAPSDPFAWAFPPPPGLVNLPDCPPGLACRRGGEYFTQAWLSALGERGPLGDSVERVATAPVYVQAGESGRLAGFCTVEGAVERTVLKVSAGLGRLATMPVRIEHGENAAENEATSPEVTLADGQLTQEQQQVLAWSLRYGSQANLGRCDELALHAPQALALTPQEGDAGMRILVDLAAVGNPALGTVASDGAVEIAAISRAVDVATGLGGGRYSLAAPVIHDANCPGQYLMGRVINREGGPVAGVRLRFRDQWGNEAVAISKNGAADFGAFDFPIPASSPHEFALWVEDEAGNPLSPPVTIQHRQGDGLDAPCHHVVLQGG